jgi:hypothetical protein
MKLIKYAVGLFIVVAISLNIFIFLQGLQLGDQIGKYEVEIAKLKEDNIELEKKLYEAQSYTYASSVAAQFNFVKQTEPIYIDNLFYAQNR